MVHPHGLVVQNETISDAALGALAARASVTLGNAFNGITATFLMKRFRIWIRLKGITSGEGFPFLVGIARGDATQAEIAAAMLEGNTSGPSDTTQMLTQDNAFVVVQKTVRALNPGGIDPTQGSLSIDIKMPGKNGVPFPEGSGWQVFIYNADDDALTTGGTVQGQAQYWGVWLRD